MAVSYDAILVPTDGSGSADRATEHALSLAERYDAAVHALYVLDDRYLSGDVEGISEVSAVESALEEEGESATEQIVERATERGLEASAAVRRGVPASTIVGYCEEIGASLISMGTHGRTGLGRILLGSVAERVVRSAPVPVLTARAVEDAPTGTDYGTILVPTDGSEGALRAAEHAVELAARYDAAIHVLSVVDTRISAVGPLFGSFEAVAEDAVGAVAELAESAGRPTTTETIEGTPAAGIVGYGEDVGADLIVMGTHGRTGFDRVTLGSVAERVVRTAPMPVVSVRHRPE